MRSLLHRALPLLAIMMACSADATAPTSAPVAPAPARIGQPPLVIVQLQPGANPDSVAAAYGIVPTHVYRHVFTGFSAPINEAARAQLLQDARVKRVADNGAMGLHEMPWGIDRSDQTNLPLSGSYSPIDSGAGVNIYIVDTGIWYTHSQFAGRAFFAYDAYGSDGLDCYGHGTHVSGTAAGNTFGMAPKATLWSVRVLDCSGSGEWAGLIAALDWIDQNGIRPAVVSMSLGGEYYPLVNDAVDSLAAHGILSVVAAGNSNADACFSSPSSAPSAFTIAAEDNTDTRAFFSNWGSCVELFAPGVNILSSWMGSDNATYTASGTSMATPHVTGAVAQYLGRWPTAKPMQTMHAIMAAATPGLIMNAGTDNNLLLRVPRAGEAPWPAPSDSYTPPVPPPNQPPVITALDVRCKGAGRGSTACYFTPTVVDSTGFIASYTYDFGDGTVVTHGYPNDSHWYYTKGVYRGSLIVLDSGGLADTTAFAVTIKGGK